MNATLRLAACVAAILLVSFAGSASAALDVCSLPSGSKDLYASVNASTGSATCASTLCSCLGASTWVNGTVGCSFTTTATRPNCTKTATCSKAYITCMNAVTAIGDLHMSLLAIASGDLYNASVAYKDCKYRTCAIFNESVTDATCTTPYSTVCVSPVQAAYTLRISGNFTAILANATAKEILRLAIQGDLTVVLQFEVTVTDLQDGSLVVLFTVPVAAGNSQLVARLSAASQSSTWMTSTQATYTSLGGTGSLGVLSLGTPAPTPVPGSITPNPPTPAPQGGSAAAAALKVLLAVVAIFALVA